MKDNRNFDKVISMITIATVVIIVFVFILTISNTHLAKGTYSDSCSNYDTVGDCPSYCKWDSVKLECYTCPTKTECEAVAEENIQYYPYGYTCSADSNGCYKIHGNTRPSSSADQYTYNIVFYNWRGSQPLGSCKAWANGKIDTSTCQGNICCGSWSTSPYQSSGGYSTQAIYGQSWVGNKTFYCVSGTSGPCYGSGYVDDEPTVTPSTEKPSTEKPSTQKPSTAAPTDKCYSCTLGIGKEYVYSKTKEEAAAKTGGTNCATVADTYCNNPPENCYSCDTKDGKLYLTTTSVENAQIGTDGGINCTIVKNSYCEIVPDNPKTGLAGIVIAWVVGLSAIVYSLWYFKKSSSISN